MIRKVGWSSFMIIYEDNESLIRISELLHPTRNLSIEIKQLPLSDDYRLEPYFEYDIQQQKIYKIYIFISKLFLRALDSKAPEYYDDRVGQSS